MTNYKTILNVINSTLDKKDISTTDISNQMKVDREKMCNFRNGDVKDTTLLFNLFDYLYPGRSDRDIVFLKEVMSTLPLSQLRNIYKNKEMILEDMKHIPGYRLDELLIELLRKIVVKTTRNQLRDSESHLVGEGLVRAGAEGFIGGVAMVGGSMLAKKVTDRMAGKNKRKQIEALEDQKRQLRAQMKQKEDDPEGRENIRKRIKSINARIDQIKGLMG